MGKSNKKIKTNKKESFKKKALDKENEEAWEYIKKQINIAGKL